MAGQLVQAIIVPDGGNIELLKEVLGEDFSKLQNAQVSQDGGSTVYTVAQKSEFATLNKPIPFGNTNIEVVTGKPKNAKMDGMEMPDDMDMDPMSKPLMQTAITMTSECQISYGELLANEFWTCRDIICDAFQQTFSSVDQRRQIITAAMDALNAFINVLIEKTGTATITAGKSEGRKTPPFGSTELTAKLLAELRRHEKQLLEHGEKAKWSKAFINGLPDSSFVCIEKGYDPKKDGMNNKDARHLPYMDADGKVDMPHLRNAMARAGQIKSVLGTETDDELRARALKACEQLRKKYMPDEKSEFGVEEIEMNKEELTATMGELLKPLQDGFAAMKTEIEALKANAPEKPVETPAPAAPAAKTEGEVDAIGEAVKAALGPVMEELTTLKTSVQENADKTEALTHAGRGHIDVEALAKKHENDPRLKSEVNKHFLKQGWGL